MAHNKLTPDSYDYNFGMYVSVPLSAFREQTIQWCGKTCLVAHLSNDDFREWMHRLLDMVEQYEHSDMIRQLRYECKYEYMDEDARWYFVNEVAELQGYKDNKLDMWTAKLQERSSNKKIEEAIQHFERYQHVLSSNERQVIELLYGIGCLQMTEVEVAEARGSSRKAIYNMHRRAISKIQDVATVEVA